MINLFQQTSSTIPAIGHQINQQLVKELKFLNQKINDYKAKSKQRLQIDENEAVIDLQKMVEMNDRIHYELDKSLLNIETYINKLVK